MGKTSCEKAREQEAQADDVSISPQEDRGGAAGTVGEGEGTAETGGVADVVTPLRQVCGRHSF
jgi:hypothetical protein